jgi:hypothetical protein
VARTAARLLLGGRDKYRVEDLSRAGSTNPKAIASDGQHRWRAFAAQTMVGPAAPLPHHIANLADSSWLLYGRLAGGNEISDRGRRAYQLSAAGRDRDWSARPLLFCPADAIVDAELGCLLRLVCYAGDRPASWWELRDIGAGTSEPGEFRLPGPPGARTVQETGNPLADAAAVMPGAAGCAVRTGVDVARRTSGAVAAARSFLDELRGTSRTRRTRTRRRGGPEGPAATCMRLRHSQSQMSGRVLARAGQRPAAGWQASADRYHLRPGRTACGPLTRDPVRCPGAAVAICRSR